MNSVELATWVGALGAWFSGFAVVLSVYFLWKQLRGLRHNIESSSYHQVQNLMINIDRFFIENTDYAEYFYRNVDVDEDHKDWQKLLLVAEMLVDHFDNVYHQSKTLPSGTYNGFKAYMQDICRNSPILRYFIGLNKQWYNPDFIALFEPAFCVKSGDTGGLQDSPKKVSF